MQQQEAQLSQRHRAMLRVTEYFCKSLKIIENGTIRKLGYSFLFAFHSNYGCMFRSSAVLGKNIWGAGPLNFPSPPLFPTPFPSRPPWPLKFPSHSSSPFSPVPLPLSLPLSFFLIPSFPSLSPFPSPPFPPLRSRPP